MAAKALMIQGTASHVGKSVLVAALCRLFLRRGFKVAPFKAQNMSNNSFVTPDGKEIGRAQAVQAAACQIAPCTDFNPVLIKPANDLQAQLVVHGVVAGSLVASDFGLLRRRFSQTVQDAYRRLASEFDLVILEGAGSPAEINLREFDIVNMRMADVAQAPVLLVGDIERGGVLASLVGTIGLLTQDERRHVKGFVINKFRGDPQLLQPGVKEVEARTGVPCLGVLPYWRDLRVPQEDALEWDTLTRSGSERPDTVVIGVADVPCVSNFTDLEALAREPDVRLVRVAGATSLELDVLIFPGTKNTVQALQFVRERGIDRVATRVLACGGTVIGLCGGYQILGRQILDPDGIESSVTELEGLGLLNVVTSFAPEKITVQVTGVHKASGQPVEGYEVHMGRTEVGEGVSPLFEVRGPGEAVARSEGSVSANGRTMGTYVHGLFDGFMFRRHFLNSVRVARGWTQLEPSHGSTLDQELDYLADFVARYLDLERIEVILEAGMCSRSPL